MGERVRTSNLSDFQRIFVDIFRLNLLAKMSFLFYYYAG